MAGPHRILIADRSELAENLYRLLLGSLDAMCIVRRRFEEVRPYFFRREGVHLAIINSNVFGKKFGEILRRFVEDEPLRRAAKIFVCRDSPAEEPWRDRLATLPQSAVVLRPFHPDELKALVIRRLDQSTPLAARMVGRELFRRGT